MNDRGLQIHDLWPIAVYVTAALLLTAAILGLSHILGQRHAGRTTGEPYESGLVPTGAAWVRFDIKYYLPAVFFVIIDLESVFIFAWAVAVREAGWRGYAAIAAFIGVLLAALLYLRRTGGLNLATSQQKRILTDSGEDS